jgi:solute carrier family 25, member 38
METRSNNTKNHNLFNSIMSGAISGTITAIGLQPFEFVKTRLQQPTSSGAASATPTPTISSIIRSTIAEHSVVRGEKAIRLSNVTKLWTGLTPALIRAIPVAAIYFGFIEYFKNIKPNLPTDSSIQIAFNSFLVGCAARTVADLCTFPLNLIKTRYESDYFSYKSLGSTFKQIIQTEGVRGLFHGLNATLIRDVSYSGVYFTVYNLLKSAADANYKHKEQSNKTSAHFASCALGSSVIACALTQPPDVVRTYMQLKPDVCKTFMDTIVLIYRTRGVYGFFSGFIPRSSRRTLISVLSWTLYEKLTHK